MTYVVVPHRTAPPVLHHESCVYAATKSGELVLFPPSDAVACNVCHGRPWVRRVTPVSVPQNRQVFAGRDGDPRRGKRVTGRYTRDQRGVAVPCECPACGSENVHREGRRMWICWQCPWMGQVIERTWELVLTPLVKKL